VFPLRASTSTGMTIFIYSGNEVAPEVGVGAAVGFFFEGVVEDGAAGGALGQPCVEGGEVGREGGDVRQILFTVEVELLAGEFAAGPGGVEGVGEQVVAGEGGGDSGGQVRVHAENIPRLPTRQRHLRRRGKIKNGCRAVAGGGRGKGGRAKTLNLQLRSALSG